MPEMQNMLDLLTENARTIKKDFVWQKATTKRFSAFIYAQAGKRIDCGKIRECHEIIKGATGVFSTFRGHMALSMAALISLSDNAEGLFARTMDVYDMMKKRKFHASEFLTLAAHQIAAGTDSANYEHTVDRARAFYDKMKAHRWFITGHDDYIFSAMLGLSQLDVETGATRIEELYKRLKSEFSSGNGVQAISQVLVQGSASDEAVSRVLDLRDEMKRRKLRLDNAETMSSLGMLAVHSGDINRIADDIESTYAFLKSQKEFSPSNMRKSERLIFAVSVVAHAYALEMETGTLSASLFTSIVNIVLLQQAANAAILAATTASVAASSSR